MFSRSRGKQTNWSAVILLGIVCLCGVRANAGGRRYFVSEHGDDANTGSQAAPFRQIRKALTLVKPGDTITVGEGSYLGFEVSDFQGSASAPLTIVAPGRNARILPSADRATVRGTILVLHSSYAVLDGLQSFNAHEAAVTIRFSAHVTVRNGVFGDNAVWGIFTSHTDYLLLEHNTCYGSREQHGIYVSNACVYPTVRHNNCHDNRQCGIHFNGDLSAGGNGLITGALIENNLVYNNGVGGGSAINLDGVHDSIVRDNRLSNNHASGIAAFQEDGASGPSGLQILSNTIDMPMDGRWGLAILHSTGPMRVRNNVLRHRNQARGGLRYGGDTDVRNTDSDDNLLDRVTPDNEDTVLTLAQWQARGHEDHSRPPSSGRQR